MQPKSVAIVVFPDFQSLDAVGPREVLSTANWLGGGPDSRYLIEFVAATQGPVRSDSGLTVYADRGIDDPELKPDILIVAGGVGAPTTAEDEAFVSQIRGLIGRATTVASVCNGAFILAKTGVLAGRSATTHWSVADSFASEFPDVDLEADRIFINDDDVWTSAGVTSGIDLTLELVRLDYGEAAAADVARYLVVYLQRSGGQNQYSTHLAAQDARHPTIRDLQTWIVENPGEDLSISALAERALMSERTFQRTFKTETGKTPGQFVERVRIDNARRLLESTSDTVHAIARQSGFGTLETFMRAFSRQLGITPSQYRGRFRR